MVSRRAGRSIDAKVAVARKVASPSVSLLKNNDTYNDDSEEY